MYLRLGATYRHFLCAYYKMFQFIFLLSKLYILNIAVTSAIWTPIVDLGGYYADPAIPANP